jgi:hypothetical protein
MRASFFLGLMGAVIVLGLAAGTSAADPNGSVLSLTVPEPTSAEHPVSYSYLGSDAPPAPAEAPKADNTAAPVEKGTCCPSCVSCEPACDPGYGHWVAGVEAVFLSPHQNHHALNYYLENTTSVVEHLSTQEADVDGLYLTPRIWLGYQGECWGFQTRYWRMSEPGQDILPQDDAGTGYTNSSVFKAETFDIEATRLVCFGKTRNVLSGGLRYGELKQDMSLSVVDVISDVGVYTGTALSRHQFSGVGPTVALTGYRPIGCENVSVFYSVRGSWLFDDDARNYVQTRASYAGTGSGDAQYWAINGANGNLFIGEIQVGVQWDFELVKNRANAFFRAAIEYQYWDTTDTGYAYATSFVSTPDYTATVTGRANDAQVSLVGFSLSTGFTW